MRASAGFVFGLMTAIMLCVALPTRAATSKTVMEFSIAPQPLSSALLQFSKQVGFQVLTQATEIKAVSTRGVRGRYTVEEALQRLLQGTGFAFELVGAETITLKRAAAGKQSKRTSTSRAPAADAAAKTAQPDSKEDNPLRGHVYVEGQRIKPYTDANVDIPRTVNDVQPYYIFDAKTIERSGAADIEDFLKNRLTANTVVQTNSQLLPSRNARGNTSSINLRGLGEDHTLVLVNGRRSASVSIEGEFYQPDINGIPLSAIERIEILPSSASGIYGGSAIGGVVNIVLKRDYSGGELRVNYENTWDGVAPSKAVTGQWGHSFEEGKTNLMLTAGWSDADPILFGDRRRIYDRGVATVLRNSNLAFFFGSIFPPQGTTPNIQSFGFPPPNLTLDNGASIGSRFTFIPPGTSADTPAAELAAGLRANAGSYNLSPPPTAQAPTGLATPLGSTPSTKSFSMALRRAFTPSLEVFVEGSQNSNHAEGDVAVDTTFFLTGNSPVNPFRETVAVQVPSTLAAPYSRDSRARSATIGLLAQLPWEWRGSLDYTWSESRFQSSSRGFFNQARINSALESGAINPFVDTLTHPLDLQSFQIQPTLVSGISRLQDTALRLSGPLPSLPWGAPFLTIGLEHRKGTTPENSRRIQDDDSIVTYFRRSQTTDSAYVEALVPLVARDRFPLLRSLELQVATRNERYTVDAGTPSRTSAATGQISYGSPRLANGQPFFSEDSYSSTDLTLGLKYEPFEGVLLRGSYGTAFLPPRPNQLLRSPDDVRLDRGFVIDGPRGFAVAPVRGGGNPDLKPQTSESWNAGLVWLPRMAYLDGLRVNLEWYQIDQFDQISALGPQFLVDHESDFPGRVTRNAGGAITLIDNSLVNLFRYTTRGWDLRLDDSWETALGTFSASASGTTIRHEQRQTAPNAKLVEYVSYVAEGGPAERKINLSLLWERGNWGLGWSARYFGSYKQFGAAGGPSSQSNNGAAVPNTSLAAQGSDTISSQTYHDFFASYALGEAPGQYLGGLLSGLSVQLNVENVFGKVPPFDATYRPYLISPYGDWRLRTYSLTVRKSF